MPKPGNFYGGWISSNVRRPFQGEDRAPGSGDGLVVGVVTRCRRRREAFLDARPKALGGDRRAKRIEVCGEASFFRRLDPTAPRP